MALLLRKTVVLTTLDCTGCRFQQAELVHCRWAMLGVVGILFPEVRRR